MKHLLGEASPEEDQAVMEWISESATHRGYYEQLRKIWDNSKKLAADSTLDVNKAWEKFQSRVNGQNEFPKILKHSRFSWMRVAASVILIAGIGIAVYFLINKNNEAIEMVSQTGQNILVDTLSDGSVITLNKKSTITYPSKFTGNKRSIALKGEAFFNVAPDKKKPFIISVNDVQVTVVGTSFNIKSENGNTEVVVETGIVRVTKFGKTVELIAGEKINMHANDSIATKEAVNDKLYNYYRTKEFVCDDTPLWKLVQVVNEAYNAKIIIGRKELSDKRLTTTFNNESLEQVLEVIRLTFDITITRKEDGQIILE
ncbi:MAG TPA: FecR domain-containing protein [Chitinophagaceae bacterium]|nr:FecR domain-containing protein [Chitinophagaceae bacterium]